MLPLAIEQFRTLNIKGWYLGTLGFHSFSHPKMPLPQLVTYAVFIVPISWVQPPPLLSCFFANQLTKMSCFCFVCFFCRQYIDDARHRLSFTSALYVIKVEVLLLCPSHICIYVKVLWARHICLSFYPQVRPLQPLNRFEINLEGWCLRTWRLCIFNFVPKNPSLPGYKYHWLHGYNAHKFDSCLRLPIFLFTSSFLRNVRKNVLCPSAPWYTPPCIKFLSDYVVVAMLFGLDIHGSKSLISKPVLLQLWE